MVNKFAYWVMRMEGELCEEENENREANDNTQSVKLTRTDDS